MKNYFFDRFIRFNIYVQLSEKENLSVGVRHGSMLGRLKLIVFIYQLARLSLKIKTTSL